MKKIDVVFILPITESLPVILAKACDRKVILYEGQDIFSEYGNSVLSRCRFYFLFCFRKITLRLVDVIIVEGKHVIQPYGLYKYMNKVKLCNVFVDTLNYRIVRKVDERAQVVAFIASLHDRKGILPFANAVIEMNKTNNSIPKFIIVGKGERFEITKNILADLVNNDTVSMIDSISEEDFPVFLNNLKLYVLPSASEGLPNTILEAMACGTPVLATPVGAIPDVIEEGQTGFLLDSIEPKYIAEKILQVLNKPEVLTEISEKACAKVQNNFSFDVIVTKWKGILDEIFL